VIVAAGAGCRNAKHKLCRPFQCAIDHLLDTKFFNIDSTFAFAERLTETPVAMR